MSDRIAVSHKAISIAMRLVAELAQRAGMDDYQQQETLRDRDTAVTVTLKVEPRG